MSAAIAVPGDTAATNLTHFLVSGLSDDTCVAERFRAIREGDIRFGWSGAVSLGFAQRTFMFAISSPQSVRCLPLPQHSAVFEDVATVMPSAI